MTQDNPRMGDLNELVERARYRVGNPSAWSEGFDDTISDEIRALLDALTSLIAERDGLREALTDIAAMTDPDDPESYRSDDREGCLDTVQAVARTALSLDTNKGDGV